MTTVEDWAVKIAEEVSPVETDLAPIWVEAFIAGGSERKDLFSQTNAQVAAILPGDFMPILPSVFKALAYIAPTFVAVLSSDMTGKFLEVVKNALAVGEVFGKSKGWFSWFSERKNEETAEHDAAITYTKLNEIMAKLDKELQPLRLSQAKTDRINLILIRLLLENPPEAKEFLDKLSAEK